MQYVFYGIGIVLLLLVGFVVMRSENYHDNDRD